MYTNTDIYMKDLHSAGPAESVIRNDNHKIPTDWSRNDLLLYTQTVPKTGADLWYVHIDGKPNASANPILFLQTEYDECFAQLSPDGHWIAYLSNESGPYDVYIQPFPSGTGKWRVSTSKGMGGTTQQPRWNPNGKELFYVTDAGGSKFTLMSASVSVRSNGTAPVSLEIGPSKPLFDVRINSFHPVNSTFFYSVSKDGQRFLIDHVESESEPVINVIVNWPQAFTQTK